MAECLQMHFGSLTVLAETVLQCAEGRVERLGQLVDAAVPGFLLHFKHLSFGVVLAGIESPLQGAFDGDEDPTDRIPGNVGSNALRVIHFVGWFRIIHGIVNLFAVGRIAAGSAFMLVRCGEGVRQNGTFADGDFGAGSVIGSPDALVGHVGLCFGGVLVVQGDSVAGGFLDFLGPCGASGGGVIAAFVDSGVNQVERTVSMVGLVYFVITNDFRLTVFGCIRDSDIGRSDAIGNVDHWNVRVAILGAVIAFGGVGFAVGALHFDFGFGFWHLAFL